MTLNNARLLRGSEDVLVSPTFKSVSDDEIFDFVRNQLDHPSVNEDLRNIEEDNLSKFGPRSIAIPWKERKESLYAYFHHNDSDAELIQVGAEAEGPGRLRPADLSHAVRNLVKASSSGLPYMTRKGNVLTEASRDWQDQELRTRYPCVLYTRTQEERKTRNVWGFPVLDTLSEQRYFIPWLTAEKRLSFRSALSGPDSVDTAISKLLRQKEPDDMVFCIDFSNFDSSISPHLIKAAFSFVSSYFQRHYIDELRALCDRFINIPIFTPDGEITGPHGVPSGSSFTNSIDSIVQYIISNVPSNKCQIQGDDGVYVVKAKRRDELIDEFRENDLTVNESKSRTFKGHNAVYLQRYYSEEYPSIDGAGLGGVYPIARALNRIKYLERWTDFERNEIGGSDFFSLRTIMILETCKHHPRFQQLVRYCQKLDKYGLKFSSQGVNAYSKMLEPRIKAGVFHLSLIHISEPTRPY